MHPRHVRAAAHSSTAFVTHPSTLYLPPHALTLSHTLLSIYRRVGQVHEGQLATMQKLMLVVPKRK